MHKFFIVDHGFEEALVTLPQLPFIHEDVEAFRGCFERVGCTNFPRGREAYAKKDVSAVPQAITS